MTPPGTGRLRPPAARPPGGPAATADLTTAAPPGQTAAPAVDAPPGASAVAAAGELARQRPPVPLRRHQREALAELERMFEEGRRRAWVVLPPGLGKTLAGLEAARRLGRPVVVFGPNTAIQGQWIKEWEGFTPDPPAAGTDRTLSAPVTVLTYQSLASFDPDAEVDEDGGSAGSAPTAHLHRLRPQGLALVEALRAAGEVTLVLDECHHLLDTWGELLAELLRELPLATVIGLTATPPDRLTRAQHRLVEELFGPAVPGPSIPAAVREGQLAPYAELAWLTTPTAAETAWLSGEAERFAELTLQLLDPAADVSVPFLNWLDQRVVRRRTAGPGADREDAAAGAAHHDGAAAALPWYRFAKDNPALAGAALRFHHQGLLALPEGARLLEEHRHPPDAADWVCLLDDWIRRCLRRSTRPGDRAMTEAVRAALPAVGYQLTARGIRGGRSPVDRVLARSAAKTAAVREILATERDALDERLRAVVVCDHERATATLPADLTGVLDAEAGSARLVLGELVADRRTAGLAPLLITGRTVAAAPETARALAEFCTREQPALRLEPRPAADIPGAVELTGNWSSRRWVALATRFFEQGGSRVLIGTRALLGEGWNARQVNTLVDLTEATTPTAVVQTRGRALRLDADWPEKTSATWSVVCVAPEHPRGTTDWDRFVRKHEGYLGVTAAGAVMSGVAHVDPALSPYAPPPAEEFEAFNAAMLLRAGQRDRTRELWRIGEPYDDLLGQVVRVTAGTRGRRARPRMPAVSGAARYPVAVPAEAGVLPADLPGARVRAGLAGGGLATVTALGGGLAGLAVPLLPVAAGAVAWGGYTVHQALTRAGVLRAAVAEPVITQIAWAVADGLRAAGLIPRGAEAVAAEPDGSGRYQLRLAGVPQPASECFATALDEALSPVTAPRYLLPRYIVERGRYWAPRRPAGNPVVYHAVPAVLGENRRRATGYAEAWRRRVSSGDPVYTRTPEGAGLLAAQAGRSPLDITTALRHSWT